MTELQHIFKAYIGAQTERTKELSARVQSLDDLSALSIGALYPEFKLANDVVVGVFNPFTTGIFDNLIELGQGSSVLSLLPFYEQVVVCVERVPAEYFQHYYGVAVPEFIELVQSGRVLPLLPTTSFPFMIFGSGDEMEYLAPLFTRNWPASDRAFRLSQHVAFQTVVTDEFGAKTIKLFTKIMVDAAREIFGDTSSGGALLNFVKLCNRAIYRGDVLLVLTWIELAAKYKELFISDYPSVWADLTLSVLDFRDFLFKMNSLVPGGDTNYSASAFGWLVTELQSKTKRAEALGIQELDDRRFALFDRAREASSVPSFDELVVLRKGFMVEPIEAVGDIRKYIHWLQHSVNVAENQKILRLFSQRLRKRCYRDAVSVIENNSGEVIAELNREISSVAFDVRTSRMMIQAGATVGGALAGAGVGNVLSTGDLAPLLAMCGAVAASQLTESLAQDIVEALGALLYRTNPAFLIWRQKQGHED